MINLLSLKNILSEMENEPKIRNNADEKKSKWKEVVKKFGIGGIIFFTVKGIISTTLIYFLGKNFWVIITNYFSNLFP